MNKLTKCLLTVSLSAALIGTAACGNGDSWKGTDFTDYGTAIVSTNGGFVAETTKYVYFINGIGSSSADNTFGTPVKGSLVAADKNDLTNSQVVIPELMTASDYEAGVYLFNSGEETYAYYGTPNTEKNSSGQVASSELTFKRTRLDGKNSEKLFTVSSLSVNYRITQAEDGTVYIVYYDTASTSLISYNCSTKKATTIAKTDDKTNEKTDGGEYLSLGEYKFLKNGSSAQIAFTLTAYTQEYYSAQAEQDGYARQTATYNYMYLYTAGKDAECVGDGKTTGETYAIKSSADDYLFYTATPFGGTAKTFGVKLSDMDNKTEIYYQDNVKDGMIIKSYEEVYYLDTEAGQVIKNTLVKTDTVTAYNTKATILKDEKVSSLIDVDDTYIYCFNSDGYIAAVNYTDGDDYGKTVRISERSASASWYKPETVTIGETKNMLFADSSQEGNSYIYYSDLNKLSTPKEVKTDEGETDYYYLENSFIGVRPAADRAAVVTSKISAIETPLDLKKGDDGKYYAESVKSARAAYDALDDDAKANVSESDVKKLENAEKALALADAFIKLEKVTDYNNLSQTEKDALTADYNAAKAIVESYGSDYSSIRDFLGDKLNLNYFYQQTGNKLNSTAE